MILESKRTIRIIMACLFLVAICYVPALCAGKNWVLVTRKAGTVETKLSSSNSWLRVPKSRRLGTEDSVRTDDKGKAHLKLSDNSIIALNSHTSVVLREFILNNKQRSVKVHMDKGHIRTQVSKFYGRKDIYQISSPNAVMAAQGTDFSVIVSGEGQDVKTTLRVISGSVLMSCANDGNRSILVPAGSSAIINGTNPPTIYQGLWSNLDEQDSSNSNGNDSNGDCPEIIDELNLPRDGDRNLHATPNQSRGNLTSNNDVSNIGPVPANSDNGRPELIVPDNTPYTPGENSTGSIEIDIGGFQSH